MRAQHHAIDEVNASQSAVRVLKGLEANILADGALDVEDDDLEGVELVLAAPHAQLRTTEDQTGRLLRALASPGVSILAHPRGRHAATRAGLVADWDRVFAEAASRQIAVEIDGDPWRQDLDHTLARRALDAGCLLALDSDAHATDQLVYAETAIAHARLADATPDRVVNCWPVDKLIDWLESRRR
jgi:histidinol phosphatase-like PHP family hydrolase